MASLIIKLIIYLVCAYSSLSAGCEYRSHHGGHKYIRCFRAKTPYQRLFTLLQCEKDIFKSDMGKLTYLGYAGVLISTAVGMIALPFAIYSTAVGKLHDAERAMVLWACLGIGWGLSSSLLQGVDSLLHRFF